MQVELLCELRGVAAESVFLSLSPAVPSLPHVVPTKSNCWQKSEAYWMPLYKAALFAVFALDEHVAYNVFSS